MNKQLTLQQAIEYSLAILAVWDRPEGWNFKVVGQFGYYIDPSVSIVL